MGEAGRLRRLKLEIAFLGGGSCAAALLAGSPPWGAGLLLGGCLVLANLLGTERTVRLFFGGAGPGRAVAVLIHGSKLLLSAGVIAFALYREAVPALALLLGLSTLPLALMADFLVFGRGEGEGSDAHT